MDIFNSIFALIADMILSLAAIFFLLRAALTFVAADFYNPVSQSIILITNPFLRLLRPVAPLVGRVDVACWSLAYLAKLLSLLVVAAMQSGEYSFQFLAVASFIELFETLIWIYIIAIIVLAVSSWFLNPIQISSNPALILLRNLSDPIVSPLRRALPRTGAIDFSPMLTLLLLYVLLVVVNAVLVTAA